MIGGEVAFSGAKDENIIPALHRLPHATFFSLDRDFYRRELAHQAYCLVWLDVRSGHAAEFIRRYLRHPAFDTQAKRMGLVVRVHAAGVEYWRAGKGASEAVPWKKE